MTLPSYTGCTFTVVYKHYECTAGSLTDYTMGDFQILSHNCPAFTSALNSAFTAGGATFSTFTDNFENAIALQIQQSILAANVPTGTFPCLQGLFFNINFLRASCYKRCQLSFSNGTASYIKIACGADCCERHTTACRDQFGVLQTSTYYVHPSPPTCTDAPIFSGNPVLSRCIRQSSCTYSCPQF